MVVHGNFDAYIRQILLPTPLGGPKTNFGFFPMAQNGLVLALKLAKKWSKTAKIDLYWVISPQWESMAILMVISDRSHSGTSLGDLGQRAITKVRPRISQGCPRMESVQYNH